MSLRFLFCTKYRNIKKKSLRCIWDGFKARAIRWAVRYLIRTKFWIRSSYYENSWEFSLLSFEPKKIYTNLTVQFSIKYVKMFENVGFFFQFLFDSWKFNWFVLYKHILSYKTFRSNYEDTNDYGSFISMINHW